VAFYAGLGVRIVRIMTDNGACYRSEAFRDTVPASFCVKSEPGPARPKTNGKAERFIQTPARVGICAAFDTSDHRGQELPH
jgi:transposase InsO family protein